MRFPQVSLLQTVYLNFRSEFGIVQQYQQFQELIEHTCFKFYFQIYVSSLKFNMGHLTYQSSTRGFPIAIVAGCIAAITVITLLIGKLAII